MVKLVEYRKAPVTGIPTKGVFVLVGYEKTGKTTFAADFPYSYVLQTEEFGGDRVDGRIDEVADLKEFYTKIKAIVDDPDILVGVIDTIDILGDWVGIDTAKGFGLESLSETKQGVNGWAVREKFNQKIESFISYLKGTGMLWILVAHCKAPSLADGQVVAPAGINVPGKAGKFIAAQAELIGFMEKKVVSSGCIYTLSFQGGPLATWGSRVKELNNKILEIPEVNPYSAFAEVFKAAPTVPTAAKPKKKTAKKKAAASEGDK